MAETPEEMHRLDVGVSVPSEYLDQAKLILSQALETIQLACRGDIEHSFELSQTEEPIEPPSPESIEFSLNRPRPIPQSVTAAANNEIFYPIPRAGEI